MIKNLHMGLIHRKGRGQTGANMLKMLTDTTTSFIYLNLLI